MNFPYVLINVHLTFARGYKQAAPLGGDGIVSKGSDRRTWEVGKQGLTQWGLTPCVQGLT